MQPGEDETILEYTTCGTPFHSCRNKRQHRMVSKLLAGCVTTCIDETQHKYVVHDLGVSEMLLEQLLDS